MPRLGPLAKAFLSGDRRLGEHFGAALLAARGARRLGRFAAASVATRGYDFAVRSRALARDALPRTRFFWSAMRGVYGVEPQVHRGELPELRIASRFAPVSVVILLADGARPDTLDAALNSGALPALARLRAEGGLHTVTSCFPSVTGPGVRALSHGPLPGSDRAAGAAMVRSRARGVHLSRLLAELRRLSDARGRPRHRRRRANDLRAARARASAR